MTIQPSADPGMMLILWMVVASAIVFVKIQQAKGGVGLVLVYVFQLVLAYWLPALFYLLPWYRPMFDPNSVFVGFEQSLYGVIAFGIGSIFLVPIWSRIFSKPYRASQSRTAINPTDLHLPEIYLGIGLVTRFVLAPLTANVPSVTAVITGLTQFLLAGQVLGCWRALELGNRSSLIKWLLLTAMWPVITTTGQGFLGFGAMMTLTVLMFMLQTVGFRWWIIPVGMITIYLGMSVLVTYSQNRDDIRAAVWTEETSISRPFEVVTSALDNFQWFDLNNPDHLDFLGRRQAQNFYIGRAVERLSQGEMDYAGGATITDSLLMLIPRAIWQDKSIRSGGSQLVTLYTGIQVYGDTSVGMGQILEFYVNFGAAGVFIGFLILGALITILDRAAARNLQQGNWQRFAQLYVPALGLLQAENPLLSITVLSISGLVAVILVNQFLLPVFRNQKPSYPYGSDHFPKDGTKSPIQSLGTPVVRTRFD